MKIHVNQIPVHYKLTGKGKDLILLHGWGCDLEIFKNIQTDLERDFKVYAIDLPGFGNSSEPPTAWGTEEYADLIAGFIQQLNIEKPIIIAHSYGGRVTIRLANRLELNKIVLTGGAGIRAKRKPSYYLKVYSYKLMKWFLQLPLIRTFGEPILEDYRKKVGSADYRSASDIMRQVLVKAVNEDLRHLLPNIKAPTLLIWGEKDTATPVSDGKLMEKMIPDAGLVVMKNATHYAFLEKGREFLIIVRHFLGVKSK